jgi:excisionase family DNA binding protein
MTVTEAADYLGVSYGYMYYLICKKKIKTNKIHGKHEIDKLALEQFLKIRKFDNLSKKHKYRVTG